MKNFTLKFALTLLLGVGLATAAMAQKIGGVVKDSAGNPVIGASVVVDGTTMGASSGVDGSWSLNVPDASKQTLVISYIGMKTQRIAIGSKTKIDVTLEDESTALDDVVVVGYATVRRRDVVGSVCESTDCLGHGRSLAVKEGTLLALRTAGAYGMSMASNYNSRPLPMEVLVSGNRMTPLRRRQTEADLFADELLAGEARADTGVLRATLFKALDIAQKI